MPISSCAYCAAGAASLITGGEAEMTVGDRWQRECGETGRPCLINITLDFTLGLEDYEDAATTLSPGVPGQYELDNFFFEGLRTASSTSKDHGNAAANSGAALQAFERQALQNPASFLRAQREAIHSGDRGDFDWYASWYDTKSTAGHVANLTSKLGDHRLAFIPQSWARKRFWYFVGWVPSGRMLRGRERHIDVLREAKGVFHVQLHGRKRWRLSPPMACQDACASAAFDVTVSAGQFFSIDTSKWYHEVSLLPSARPNLAIARFYYSEEMASDAEDEAHGLPPFGKVDADADGLATEQELVDYFARHMEFDLKLEPGLKPSKAMIAQIRKMQEESEMDLFRMQASTLIAAADADGDGRLSRHEHMAHAAREAHTRSGDGSSGCAATDTVAEGGARVLERQFPFLRAARQLQDPTRCDAQA